MFSNADASELKVSSVLANNAINKPRTVLPINIRTRSLSDSSS